MELSGSFGCVVELTCGMRLTGPEIVFPQLDHNLTSRFCQVCWNYLSSSAALHPFCGKALVSLCVCHKKRKVKTFPRPWRDEKAQNIYDTINSNPTHQNH
jgi:predicted amidophosphoribosyltransferase